MTKHLLILAVACTFASASAQQLTLHPNLLFEHVSEDGRYFSGSIENTVTVYDAQEGTYHVYEAYFENNTPLYSVGFGSVFSQDGTMVGNIDYATPAILKNNEWIALPITEEDGTPGKNNSADAITLDGKRICGGIAPAAMSIDAQDVMLAPVIWDMQADGTYGMYQKLPYPTKDFTGRTAQYVTARFISNDGKTIVGQIVDWSGFFPMPIVYKQADNGDWSYEVFGRELVYDTTAVFPDYPVYEPVCPYAEDYLDEAGAEAYNNAVTAYNDSVSAYWFGEIEDYPTYYPDAKDFLSGESQTTFEALFAQFQTENAAYQDSLAVFDAVFYDPNVVYESNYEFNNMALSADGKYYATSLNSPDTENDDPYAWGPSMLTNAFRFDLTSNKYTYEKSNNSNALVSGIMNDGTVLLAATDENNLPQAALIKAGSTADVPFIDYLTEVKPQAVQLLTDSLTYSIIAVDEETWEPIEGESGVQTGTVSSNGNGTVFCGWIQNNFYTDEDWYFLSYTLDLNKQSTGIKATLANTEVTSVVVTDLNGNTVYNAGVANFNMKNLNKGVYFITLTTADGCKQTNKIIRQ